MARALNLIGQRFGRLTVISSERRKRTNGRDRIMWRCQCDCGGTSLAISPDLRSGRHRSCGCLQIDAVSRHGHTKHGGAVSPSYRSWSTMRQRCQNPNAAGYEVYGGRGISVCERWDDFGLFLADMGERPSLMHSIDRIDVDGNYEPNNCRWATRKEQAANRRVTDKMLQADKRRKRDRLGRYA